MVRSVHAEGDDGLATAMEPVQSLAEEQNFPELYAVFVQQQLPLSMLLQFQPEPLLPAQELPLKHDASACTSKRSAVAREERRIGHLPPRTEARRLSTFGLRKSFGYAAASQTRAPTAHQQVRGLELGVGAEGAGACRGRRGVARSAWAVVPRPSTASYIEGGNSGTIACAFYVFS